MSVLDLLVDLSCGSPGHDVRFSKQLLWLLWGGGVLCPLGKSLGKCSQAPTPHKIGAQQERGCCSYVQTSNIACGYSNQCL